MVGNSTELPLTGLRVADFSTLLPGPYCTHLLSQLGAEVVKFEPFPHGDPVRQMSPLANQFFNRGKKSVCIDIRTMAGQQLVLELLQDFDVVVEGFRPRVMDRLGLGHAALHTLYPYIVYCSISGYGQTGPYAQFPGHDTNFLAAAGWFATGLDPFDDTLARPRIRMADLSAAMFAALSIVAHAKKSRNERQAVYLDASMYDSIASLALPNVLGLSDIQLRQPLERHDVVADNAIYLTRDGVPVSLATMEDKFWLALTNRTQEKFPALSNPDWQTRMGRTRCKASVATALKDFFSSLALSELIDLLPQQEVPWMRVMRGKDMLSDAHLLARGLVNGEGTDQQVGYPVMVNGERPLAPTGDCVLGDHTQDLLQSIGFNQDRIAQLIRKGVISPSPKSAK